MATDNLTQLGRTLRKTKNNINHSSRRISENFPLLEALRDAVSPIVPFRMEFDIYQVFTGHVSLSLKFLEEFDVNAGINLSRLPLSITDVGVSIGYPGEVGIEGVWYPLVKMGDLNFLASSSYTVVFDIVTYGTGTYQHKIVFDGGGVNLTGSTIITSTQITVTVEQSNVISPPNTIMKDAYIYGLVTGFSPAGWLHYSSVTIYDANGLLYTPRLIGVY